MNSSLAKRKICGWDSTACVTVSPRASAQNGCGAVQAIGWLFIASPDVSRAWRVGRADDAVAEHGVGLHHARELGHAGIDLHHARPTRRPELACTVTLAEALIVMPADSSLIELPLASSISTAPPPSLSVTFWPPGVSRISFSFPSLVVERDLHAIARAKHLLVVLAVAVHRFGRRVLAVPDRADHIGAARVAGLEGHQHLVVDVGNEPGATVVAGHEAWRAAPTARRSRRRRQVTRAARSSRGPACQGP